MEHDKVVSKAVGDFDVDAYLGGSQRNTKRSRSPSKRRIRSGSRSRRQNVRKRSSSRARSRRSRPSPQRERKRKSSSQAPRHRSREREPVVPREPQQHRHPDETRRNAHESHAGGRHSSHERELVSHYRASEYDQSIHVPVSGERDRSRKSHRSRSTSRHRRRKRKSSKSRRRRSKDSRHRRGERRSRDVSRHREHKDRHRRDDRHERRHRRRSTSRASRRSASLDSDAGLDVAARTEKRKMQALTRDARTVLVTQLQVKVTERDLKSFFQAVCDVRSAVLLRDKNSNRSKGVGYVEVKTLQDVPKALMLNNQPFVFRDGHQSFPICVKASEAEKNFNHLVEKQAAATAIATQSTSLHVGNLHPKIGESDLLTLFSTFGPVLRVQVTPRSGNNSDAIVEFGQAAHATAALRSLNGTDFVGVQLRINRAVPETVGNEGSWKLEDDSAEIGRVGGGGMSMNSNTREILMRNLAGGTGHELMSQAQKLGAEQVERNMEVMREQAEAAALQTIAQNAERGAIVGMLSQYLRIRNMFDPATEEGDDWDVEIKEDTISECSKFGKVVHCAVDKENPGGHVYIAFEDLGVAQTAAEKLHGRWFAKRMLQVEYLKPSVYKQKYPF